MKLARATLRASARRASPALECGRPILRRDLIGRAAASPPPIGHFCMLGVGGRRLNPYAAICLPVSAHGALAHLVQARLALCACPGRTLQPSVWTGSKCSFPVASESSSPQPRKRCNGVLGGLFQACRHMEVGGLVCVGPTLAPGLGRADGGSSGGGCTRHCTHARRSSRARSYQGGEERKDLA